MRLSANHRRQRGTDAKHVADSGTKVYGFEPEMYISGLHDWDRVHGHDVVARFAGNHVSMRAPGDYARWDGNSRIARRCHSELSRPSRLSKPQRIAAKSRVNKSATKMMKIIMVCSFLFFQHSVLQKSVSTYSWIPVFPTSVIPEKERRYYDLEHSLVVSLHTDRRSM
jgi:hypothetical protein